MYEEFDTSNTSLKGLYINIRFKFRNGIIYLNERKFFLETRKGRYPNIVTVLKKLKVYLYGLDELKSFPIIIILACLPKT